MKSRLIGLLTILVLCVSATAVPVSAAVKAGAKCKVVGQIKVKKNKEFTCTAKGKKLVWRKEAKVVTASGVKDNTESELILSQVIEGEDIERRAIVMLPGDYDPNTAYAIVLGFHGNGQSPEDFAWMAQRVCSFELPCIAVVPEGYKRSWNLGVEESTADDVAFVSDVIAELSSQYPLTSDFFAIGHSNGSGLVHVLATETSLLKGIAGFGSMLIEGREPSAETSAVSVLQVHGMDDDVIPYDGGDSPVGLRFVPAEQSATLWGSVNGCDAGTGETEDTGDRILMFEGCVDDHRVLHYGLAGQGHDAGMSEEFALIASEFFASVR